MGPLGIGTDQPFSPLPKDRHTYHPFMYPTGGGAAADEGILTCTPMADR